jgi:biotin carboxyl carrier protein
MRLETGGVRLVLSKDGGAPGLHPAAPRATAVAAAATHDAPAAVAVHAVEPVATPPPGTSAILAPSLGIVWLAPKPTEPPFVAVGDVVDADTTVCLIEVMKLFTPVKAGLRGRVVRVVAGNGQLAEYGEPLFWIEPAN